jgi:hypothetical protein
MKISTFWLSGSPTHRQAWNMKTHQAENYYCAAAYRTFKQFCPPFGVLANFVCVGG